MNFPENWIIEQQIRERAYFLWMNDNCSPNGELYYWLIAEEEINQLYKEAERIN